LLAGWYPGALWAALWPVLAALGLAGLALRRDWRLPQRLEKRPNLALRGSLALTRLLRHPPLPEPTLCLDKARWRRRERRWNRLWEGGTLTISAWLLVGLLWLGWLW